MSGPSLSGQAVPRRRLGFWSWLAVGVAGVLMGALGWLGAFVSFSSVEVAMRPSFGERAWAVPVGVDAGIAVLTLLDLVLTWLDLRIRWLRPVMWVLVGVTIFLNVAVEDTWIGRVGHGVLPWLWVIAVEAAGESLRKWAGLTRPKTSARRLERIPASRWVLAPVSSLRLWRRARLQEVPADVLRFDLAQDLALAALQQRFWPVVWRVRAPRWARAMYRHGHLTPAHLGVEFGFGDGATTGFPPTGRSPGRGGVPAGGSSPASARRQAPPTKRRNGTKPARVELPVELVDVGRQVARQVQAEGRRLTRDELVARVRAEGRSCPNDKAGALLALLQAEATEAQGVGA